MKIGQILRTLGSGTALYLVMAACGASDRAGSSAMVDGGSSGVAADGSEIIDAFVDELGDPVKEAAAGPLPPDVATEACDKQGTISGGTTAFLFAVHSYPGKTTEDLSSIRALGHFTAAAQYSVGGSVFGELSTRPALQPGAAAVACGTSTNLTFDSVKFILPN